MKKGLIAGVMIVFAIAVIYANVREAYYYDKFYSGNIKFEDQSDSIVFLSEELSIVFPELIPDAFGVDDVAEMNVTYHLMNSNPNAVPLYVQFVGINVQDPLVSLNGTILQTQTDRDDAAELDFIIKLAEHRLDFLEDEFEAYFNRIDFYLSDEIHFDSVNSDTLSNLINNGKAGEISVNDVFYQAFGHVNSEFDLVGFELLLEPGENELTVNYRQGLFISERSPGYGSIQLGKALLGIDYLFYPAFDWNLSEDFALSVAITVPDYQIRKNIFTPRTRPQMHSNLEFTETYDKKTHLNTYTNTFYQFPSEIFSFYVETKK